MTKLFKDGNSMGVSTNCRNAGEFIEELSWLLDDLITQDRYKGDWAFQLSGWFHDAFAIVKILGGGKATGQRFISSGNTRVEDQVGAFTFPENRA